MTLSGASSSGIERERAAVLRPGSKLYDFLFGLPLILWYAASLAVQGPMLLHEMASAVAPHADRLLLLNALSRSAALLFAAVLIGLVAIRKPASSSASGLMPKVVAFLGAFLGVTILYLKPYPLPPVLQVLSLLLTFGGMAFAVYALLWLGRCISVMSEARSLVTGGPYALVRHPLYLGEETALAGIALQFLSPMAIVIFVLQLVLQLHRMRYEESVMRDAFPDYAAYAGRVKRIIPGLY